MVVYTCNRCGKNFPKLAKLPSTPLLQNPTTNQIPTQTYVPVGDLIQLDGTPSSPIQNIFSDNFNNIEDRYNASTDKKWPELAGTLLYDYPKRNIIMVEGNFGGKPVRKNYRLTNKELIFEECESNLDPLRLHQNLTAMSLWQAVIPSSKNIKYRFNYYVEDHNKYLEAPYMPQLIANAREQITKVLKAELCKKDQIKTALIAQCIYSGHVSKGKDKLKSLLTIIAYHRSLMCIILTKEDINEHINLSISEIDNAIDSFMQEGSGMNLVRIEMLTIEAYTFQRTTGGSYISTSKKLANTKCTINSDNSDIINLATGKSTDNCLKGALGCYFADKAGITDHLERRIYRAKSLQLYLNIVKLDGIPMPTPICSRIFNKIEEINSDISINVWELKEETATPKAVIASKNYKRQHIIDLIALTDITKSKDKYGQKNHFLWINNLDELVYRDTTHHGKRYLCRKCTISWPSEKAFANYFEHCLCLEEATQEVKLPIKDINDFEKFKNYGRMINASYVIIADFEADNKKCNKKYGGQMQKLAEQKANSFCYLEFVKRINKELVEINRVLAIKHDRIETDKDKKKFNEADSCWICKEKFIIDKDKVKCLENKALWLNNKLKNTSINSEDYKTLTKQIDKITKDINQKKSMDIKVWDHCHITGVYPYDYIDSQNRFLETELLPIHEFSTYLHDKISQKDYEHAQKVWKEFNCKTLDEYHDIYLKTDVLSLADVWTQLQKMSMEYDGLDPSHYVSLSAYSWDAMLKMTEVKIELFTDMAMHDFIEKAKRGGIAMAYATNLYGWAMNQYLPIGNYKWKVSHKYLENNPNEQKKYLEKILNTKADAKRGYFLNIKAYFSLKTHDYLSDLPPAVENMVVSKNMLCSHTTELVDNLDSRHFSATEKLVPYLGSQEDYIIHYQELQYYVKLDMIVDEVTEILSFDQNNWLTPYIVFNTEKCNEAKKARNIFLSDFFKLKNNAVYGKTMENICKPSFKYARQLGPLLIRAHIGKASITLNKPIIVGASVLSLSKLHMYHFWYGYIKERYSDNAQLGYKDTDLYLFQVETEDIYKDMKERPDLFNLNGDTTIGKYKDETPDSKAYHYVLANKSTTSKHKEVSKKDCLFGNEVFHAKNIGIRSKDHILSLVESEKKALCPIDTKHWILSDKITSLPYGHWCIQAYKNFVSNGISSELAEQKALSVKLSKRYQNEYVSHISMTL
ncbi:22496_t:CDS:2 [Cetraspora pellucida]|uniref:22496_t:CDS:1 n=1 Tax=Cetraspora pellucida TaxID=1433469 RepID=A0A9N8ZP09_9GLOM|nr:22496_t:CDS:2 [Cetraspora pellucida]